MATVAGAARTCAAASRPCWCRRLRVARQTRPPRGLAIHLGTPSASAAFHCRLSPGAPVVGRPRNSETATYCGRPTGLPFSPIYLGAAATDPVRQAVSPRAACGIPAYPGRHGGGFGGSVSHDATDGQGADPL